MYLRRSSWVSELFAKQIIPPQMDSVLFCHMRSILQGDKKRLTYQYRSVVFAPLLRGQADFIDWSRG
jgi:hypothetical protein